MSAGVAHNELQRLRLSLAQLGPQGAPPRGDSLLPFLRVVVSNNAGRFVAVPAQQPLIRSLNTQAPACQVLPPTLYDAAAELKAQRRLTIEAEATLAAKSPVLHQFVKSVGSSQEDRRHLAKFMCQLLQVRHSTW